MSKLLPAEEENEAEVRREDQENINRFARLNARLGVVREERDSLKVGLAAVNQRNTFRRMNQSKNGYFHGLHPVYVVLIPTISTSTHMASHMFIPVHSQKNHLFTTERSGTVRRCLHRIDDGLG